MQYLETVSRSPQVSWYRLLGEHQGAVQRWVVSTPQSIDVCNRPEVCGVDFSRNLREAMAAALSTAPFVPLLRSVPSTHLCIMNFLRGGLNFDLRNALFDSLGSNLHATCFMSSQRSRKEGRWVVKEDMYRKMQIPRGAIMLVGDVVATGVTVDNGFDVIVQHLDTTDTPIAGIVFFTIGCHKIEKVLEKVHVRLAERFPTYKETHVVYLEAKLRLVDSSTHLMIAIQGTDLIKRHALLSPEFEASQYSSLAAPLERCAIYDAGSRAFDVAEYFADVTRYWEQVRQLARRGYTLAEALKERWPEVHYSERSRFFEIKHREWPGVDDEWLDDLWKSCQARWTPDFLRHAQTPEALEAVCRDRLTTLQGIVPEQK